MEYLRAILNGRKRYFKNEQARKVRVPRFRQLTTAKVLDYVKERPDVMRYLPNFRLDGEPTVDREFMFTVLNTLEPDYFPAQLEAIEHERKQRIQTEEDDVIEVRPEILELLDAFDMQKTASRGSARALCMLKKGAKKRKTPRTSGMFVPGNAKKAPGTTTKRPKMST